MFGRSLLLGMGGSFPVAQLAGGRLVVFEVSGVGGCGVGEGVGDDEGDLVVLASWTVYQSTLSVWKE